jgi:putative restriction endonuclease
MTTTYGHIPGIEIGHVFKSRQEACDANIHRQPGGGIWGGKNGAYAISVNGGYVDDQDFGDKIVYTGQGGRDASTGKQVADQKLVLGNLGLAVSCDKGNPVRVIRGKKTDQEFACTEGYRYDGLYYVTSYGNLQGKDGFKIYYFVLEAAPGQTFTFESMPNEDSNVPTRVEQTTLRIVRDTALAKKVKEKHSYTCQVCGTQLKVASGLYAEAAHVRGLGAPHHGPDTADNILCLCPNHHVMFDKGTLWIDDEYVVQPVGTPLLNLHINGVNLKNIIHHRTFSFKHVDETC